MCHVLLKGRAMASNIVRPEYYSRYIIRAMRPSVKSEFHANTYAKIILCGMQINEEKKYLNRSQEAHSVYLFVCRSILCEALCVRRGACCATIALISAYTSINHKNMRSQADHSMDEPQYLRH